MEMSTLTLTDVTERLYRLEREHAATRRWSFVLLMLLVANLGLVVAVIQRAARPSDRARFTSVEARQFVLADARGARRGVLEVSAQGVGRFALIDGSSRGNGQTYFQVDASTSVASLILTQAWDGKNIPRSVDISAEPKLSLSSPEATYAVTARGTGRPAH